MCPGGEGPGVVADEVGTVVCDAEVVDHLPRAGVVHLAQRHTVTEEGEEPIGGLETARGRPAFPFHIKGVFRGGADQFAVGEVKVQDTPRATAGGCLGDGVGRSNGSISFPSIILLVRWCR